MSNTLLPCPFCGGVEGDSKGGPVVFDHEEVNRYGVICWTCGVETTRGDDRDKIIAAWNRRAVRDDERAWLIEMPGPLYWTGREGRGAWHTHVNACRFSRWEDADRVRRSLGFDDAKVTEHCWP